jgi:aerobic carbon-monoxide dehydrogenase small subunit
VNKQLIAFQLNGEPVEIFCDPSISLLSLLRNQFGLYGIKEGCSRGECGACTVLLDEQAVNSCLVPAGKAEGRSVVTIEGVRGRAGTHPIQEAFVEKGAVQCGFCTPGMVMSAYALLKRNQEPTSLEIKTAISGNICRCSGYIQIEEAIQSAAEQLKKPEKQ